MAKQKRVAVEPNIYEYPDGRLQVQLRVGQLPPRTSRLFPPDTARAKLRALVVQFRRELTDELRAFGDLPAPARRSGAASLEAQAAIFLPQIAGRESFQADRSHVRAWLALVLDGETRPLGRYDLEDVTTEVVNLAIAQWQRKPGARAIRKIRVEGYARPEAQVPAHAIAGTTVRAHARVGAQAGPIAGYARAGSTIAAHTRRAGLATGYVRSAPATSGSVVAPRTIRHRCRVLDELCRTLQVPSPVAGARVPSVPAAGVPVRIPADVLRPLLVKLRARDVQTFCRYAVFCTTLQRPAQIMRAQPEDVDLEHGIWVVRSAKNEPAHSITLGKDARAAWTAFAAASAWGEFKTARYGRLIHAAGLPAAFRPYSARHTGAFAAIAAGVSLGDVQALLGHTSPETTRRFYAPFVVDIQRKASTAIDGRFAGLFRPQLLKKKSR